MGNSHGHQYLHGCEPPYPFGSCCSIWRRRKMFLESNKKIMYWKPTKIKLSQNHTEVEMKFLFTVACQLTLHSKWHTKWHTNQIFFYNLTSSLKLLVNSSTQILFVSVFASWFCIFFLVKEQNLLESSHLAHLLSWNLAYLLKFPCEGYSTWAGKTLNLLESYTRFFLAASGSP